MGLSWAIGSRRWSVWQARKMWIFTICYATPLCNALAFICLPPQEVFSWQGAMYSHQWCRSSKYDQISRIRRTLKALICAGTCSAARAFSTQLYTACNSRRCQNCHHGSTLMRLNITQVPDSQCTVGTQTSAAVSHDEALEADCAPAQKPHPGRGQNPAWLLRSWHLLEPCADPSPQRRWLSP